MFSGFFFFFFAGGAGHEKWECKWGCKIKPEIEKGQHSSEKRKGAFNEGSVMWLVISEFAVTCIHSAVFSRVHITQYKQLALDH